MLHEQCFLPANKKFHQITVNSNFLCTIKLSLSAPQKLFHFVPGLFSNPLKGLMAFI